MNRKNVEINEIIQNFIWNYELKSIEIDVIIRNFIWNYELKMLKSILEISATP